MICSLVLAWEARTYLRRVGGRHGVRNAFRLTEVGMRVWSVAAVAIMGIVHLVVPDAGLLILSAIVCSTAGMYLSACDEPPPPTVSLAGAGA